MMTRIPPDLWLLAELALCGGCGTPLTPLLEGRVRRFYAFPCSCNELCDADPLEQAIVAAAADLEWRQQDTRHALRPYIVVHRWRQADHAERRRRLTRLLTHVLVDPISGTPTCLWIIPSPNPSRAPCSGTARLTGPTHRGERQ